MLPDRCPVCLSVCLSCLYVCVCLKRPMSIVARRPPPERRGHNSPQFSAHIYCGQTAGWIKMPLGREVGNSQATLCTVNPIIFIAILPNFLTLSSNRHYGRPMEYGQPIIFSSYGFFFLLFFLFPRLISAVADWMSAIPLHMVWP